MKQVIQSIRFRLTFYFLFIFAGLLIFIAAVILYSYKTYSIERGKMSLKDKSFVMGAWVDFANKDFSVQIQDYIVSQEANLSIQLFDRKGLLIGKAGALTSLIVLPKKACTSIIQYDEPYIYESANSDYFIAVNDLYDGDKKKGFVQIIQSKESLLNHYNYLFKIVVIVMVFSIIISVVAGAFLVSQLLSPINKIITTVAAIRPEKLDPTRLIIANPNDELGKLSKTINNLLDRISKTILIQRQFTSDAAHELRTPLTIVKGNTEVALMKDNADVFFLNKNLVEINYLISLTNDLLFISRFDAESNLFLKNRFNFSTLISDTVATFQSKAMIRKISIVSMIEDDIHINADSSLLKKAIYNILDNALKYSPDGTSLSVSLEKISLTEFKLSMQDEGIGIAEDKIHLIFERFYRVVEDRGKNIEGTGLGLAIVKSIIQLHDYKLEVKSQLGFGSTFAMIGKYEL